MKLEVRHLIQRKVTSPTVQLNGFTSNKIVNACGILHMNNLYYKLKFSFLWMT